MALSPPASQATPSHAGIRGWHAEVASQATRGHQASLADIVSVSLASIPTLITQRPQPPPHLSLLLLVALLVVSAPAVLGASIRKPYTLLSKPYTGVSLKARESSQRAWAFVDTLQEDNKCDMSCSTSPYMLVKKSEAQDVMVSTAGLGSTVVSSQKVRTTCLGIVALGCFGNKGPCCSSLAAQLRSLSMSIDATCENALVDVLLNGDSIINSSYVKLEGDGTKLIIDRLGLDYWSALDSELCITLREPCLTLPKLCNSTAANGDPYCLYSLHEASRHQNSSSSRSLPGSGGGASITSTVTKKTTQNGLFTYTVEEEKVVVSGGGGSSARSSNPEDLQSTQGGTSLSIQTPGGKGANIKLQWR
eukprot:gene29168-32390_t